MPTPPAAGKMAKKGKPRTASWPNNCRLCGRAGHVDPMIQAAWPSHCEVSHVARSAYREIGTKGCGQALIEMPTPAHVLRFYRPPATPPFIPIVLYVPDKFNAYVAAMNCGLCPPATRKIMLHLKQVG